MTVSTTDRKVNYIGDGVTTEFFYSFRVDEISWMSVLLDDVVQSSGFVVNRDENRLGGSVVFDIPPKLDVVVTLARVVPQTQEIAYPSSPESFPVDTHENGFDKQTMMIQDLQEQAIRTIGVVPSDDGSTSLILPPYEAGKLIAWCPDQQALCNVDPPECSDPFIDPYRQIYGRISADSAILKKGGNINFNVQNQGTGVHRITFAEQITEDYVVVVGLASSTTLGWGASCFVTSENQDGFSVQTQNDETGAAEKRDFTFHLIWELSA